MAWKANWHEQLVEWLSWQDFSNVEKTLIAQICTGMGNKEITEAVGMNRTTIDYYVRRIFDKIGVDSRTKLIVWASRQLWLHRFNADNVKKSPDAPSLPIGSVGL